MIVPCDKAHLTVEYEAKRYPLAADDETNEPVAAADGTATALPYNEWDRYCEWTMEWGVETLTAPIGAYKYVSYDLPINNYVQFQSRLPRSLAESMDSRSCHPERSSIRAR